MKTYIVQISKWYFPEEIWAKEQRLNEVFRQVKVRAENRTEAAKKVWEKFGKQWLGHMKSKEGSVRMVSLYVNEPVAGVTGLAGRLMPIRVYEGE